MTKHEMLTKAITHMEAAAQGPFLTGTPLQRLEYQFDELYNACRMFGAVLEELVQEDSERRRL
jgi:hypothetical protein